MKFSIGAFSLIIVGISLILSSYGVFDLNLGRDWPWLLIIIGIMSLFEKKSKKIRIDLNNVLTKLKNGKLSIEEAEEIIKRNHY